MWRGLVEDLIRNFSGPLGIRLRRAYYKRRLRSCGDRLVIEPGVYISGGTYISFGDDVWIDKMVVLIAGPPAADTVTLLPSGLEHPSLGTIKLGSRTHIGVGSIIQGHGGVVIGDDFTTSAHAKIFSMSNDPRACRHGTMRVDNAEPLYIMGAVTIGRNVWLGANVSVFSASIGSDCFVKAGSVVSQPIADNGIASGAPARRICARFE